MFRRATGYEEDAEFSEAVVFESGEHHDLLRAQPEEFAEALNVWLVERGDPERVVSVKRSRSAIGAKALSVAIVLTFIAAGAGGPLEDAHGCLRERLLPASASSTQLGYLLSLDNGDLAHALRTRVASATDRRSSELATVQVLREGSEVSGLFDTPSGTRYVIRVTDELSRIRLVENPAR